MRNRFFLTGFLLVASLILSSFIYFQLFPTKLRVEVRNTLGNIEEKAKVAVYSSAQDYRAEENAVAGPEFTDKKGRLTFKDLEPKVYFIHAEKGDKNNDGKGVQTDTLQAGKKNEITIIIE